VRERRDLELATSASLSLEPAGGAGGAGGDGAGGAGAEASGHSVGAEADCARRIAAVRALGERVLPPPLPTVPHTRPPTVGGRACGPSVLDPARRAHARRADGQARTLRARPAVPEALCCQITFELMGEPVRTPSGQTYALPY
jgi:hypothetical protein